MRKKRAERQIEILDAAVELFVEKGYENATINDILNKVGIGKGTFYHYFESKEQVMNEVIQRMVDYVVDTTTIIAQDEKLTAHQKMTLIINSLSISSNPDGAMIEELHQSANAKMHQNSIVATVKAVSPIIAEVIEQGIREGVYSTPYPRETIEIILAANQSMFDKGIFTWSPEELESRAIAFVRIIELSLGAESGSFSFVLDAVIEN